LDASRNTARRAAFSGFLSQRVPCHPKRSHRLATTTSGTIRAARELERYQHLSPLFRAQTVDLIAQVLFSGTHGISTPTDTPPPSEEDEKSGGPETLSPKGKLAGWTGLEPATSDVTGRRSNQLNYHPARWRRAFGGILVGGTGFEPVTPGV
jgi:hypothetical protein